MGRAMPARIGTKQGAPSGLVPHSLKSDEVLYRDHKGRQKSSLASDWKKTTYEGKTAHVFHKGPGKTVSRERSYNLVSYKKIVRARDVGVVWVCKEVGELGAGLGCGREA